MSDSLEIEDIDAMLEFLPYFKDKSNVFYTIDKKDLFYPYRYSEEVNKFLEVVYTRNIVYFFDWGSFQDKAMEYYENPKLLGQVDFDTLRKLLTLHIRKDRFCDGHFGHMIKSGQIVGILERLEELRKDI
ncbi:MAG: hypothetical protein JW770_06700 [Actinobacteria bacterium]|nr:hypothetical protein [Actinomycetota bacterium]